MKNRILYNGLVFGLIGAMYLASFPLPTKAASVGALDFTFSGDGKVLTNIIGDDDANNIAVQPDGKIIVVGRVEPGGNGVGDFLVARYNPDGLLDPTFNIGGFVTTNFGNSETAHAVALQTDGKIVVAGFTLQTVTNNIDFAVARYNPDGSLDTTFSDDGMATTGLSDENESDIAWSVLIQPDGKIVVAGSVFWGGSQDLGLFRYNADGTLDGSFTIDGKVHIDNGGGINTGYDIKLQTDGKIVAVGGNTADFVIYRVNTNGALDVTFSGDGMVTTNFSGSDLAFSVQIMPDGRIVAAGSSDANQNSALARYNTNGSLDNSFGNGGRVLVNLNPSGADRIPNIKLHGNGKILAAVRANSGNFLGVNAARFNSNGSLDQSFGKGGTVTTSTQADNVTEAIAITGSEVLVVSDGDDVSIARFNLNIRPTQANDFDGDGFSDYVIFRPATATWYVLQSFSNTTEIVGFGANGDVPLDGDFDGDGRNDVAIFRPASGQWWYRRSSDNTVFAAQFGATGDKPVPGDVDKDGKADFVFWRPANGNYFVLRSSDNFSTFYGFPFGANGDIPVGTASFP